MVQTHIQVKYSGADSSSQSVPSLVEAKYTRGRRYGSYSSDSDHPLDGTLTFKILPFLLEVVFTMNINKVKAQYLRWPACT